MGHRRRYSQILLLTIIALSVSLSGCSKDASMEAKEQQAIQLVKAYTPEGRQFSVISNIEKQAEENNRKGAKWELGAWEAGLPSQKDFVIEKLSQYFNVFRPAGDYWVRFSYKDKNGVHEAMWDVNIYSKQVVQKNDVAKQFSPEGS
jgi:hypothetical protein